MKTTLPFFPFALQHRNGERSTVIFRNYFVRILCLFAATFVCAVSVFAQTTTFNFSGAIVNYTVPAGVTKITIVAKGAQGGNTSIRAGGLGASIQGDFIVTPGQVLKILVGQQGGTNTNNAGGGGGSFVTTNTNSPLIVAGGGGGASCSLDGLPGLTTTGGTNGGGSNKQTADGSGGVNGGGGGGSANNNGAAAGGAGLLGNGGNGAYSSGIFCYPTGGAGGNGTNGGNASGGAFCSGYTTTTQNSFINGGQSNTYGGFGGGGGVTSYYSCYISGGGGGYSGGGAGSANPGGGGGSYNNGTAQVNVAGVQSGNGVVTITPFPPATALNFDPSLPAGDNSRLNYVAIDNPFRTYQKEITVEYWMYVPDAKMPFGSVMGQATSNVDNNWVWLMHPNDNGTMTFYVNDGGAARTANCNIIAGSWHHYAGVASATATRFYIDGALVSTGAGISGNVFFNSTSVIHIGKDVRYATRNIPNNDPQNRYARMTIDEVRIWSRALCQEEINNNINAEINPAGQTGLQEYYRFNQGIVNADNTSETTLNDLSGNNRNGTLLNFTLNGASSNWVTSGSTNTGVVAPFVAPTAPITGATSVCTGAATTLANAVAGGKWTSSNTAVATINAATGVVNALTTGSTTITYTTGCGGVSTAVLTVNSTPVFTVCPTNKVTGNDAGQCNAVVSYSATASGSPAPSLSYTFSGATTGSGSGTGSGQTFNVGVTTVTITATNTCGSASCSFTVTVTALDSDGDGIPDACDDDADNDGIPNAVECNKSNFFWSTPPTVSGNTATGTINGIGYTYTSSSPVTTTTNMFAHSVFPVSYGVPNANPTIQNIYVTNNTLSFASPMTNPVLVFASIGQGGLSVPISFGAPIQVVWSQNVVQNSSTQITGTEGYAIIRMMGTFSSISFNYLAAENYCNFAFGADFMTCGDTDGDGIPDYLDTDSDGDGCPDAIEGSMSFSMSQTSNGRLIGGVNSRGIPLLAGNGQGLGTSQNYVANCFCQAGLDETKPVVITKNITVNLDASGNAAITAAQVNNGSTDNCSIAGMTVSKTNFNCSNLGANTVTLSVTDNQGNVGTATATVTVQDVTPPTISCPANISIVATSAAGAVVTYVAPVGTDNCSGATTALTAGLPSGSTFPLGTTTVTHTVTDGAGLTASCSFTVTVTGLAPSIVCPSNIVVNNDPGQCSAVVNFAATETTGVPASTITYSIPSGSAFALGTTTVTATATNAVGVSTCTFTVTVKDVTPPTIVCAANVTVNADAGQCNASVTVPAPTTSDNCNSTNNSLNFDGSNDYVNIPRSISGDFTMEYWMKTTQTTSGGPQWYHGIGVVDAEVGGVTNDFGTSLNGSKICFGTGNPDKTIFSVSNVNTGQWIHVAVTRQQSTGQMILYINGVQESSTFGSVQTLNVPSRILLGVMQTGVNGYFKGNIGGLRLWNKVRTASEISSNMNASILPQAGLVANYEFNQGTANANNAGVTNLADNSGNGNNGTLNNFALTGSTSNWTGGILPSSIVTLTNNFNNSASASGVYPVGVTNITWTATDASGNSSTCTQTVTVLDNQPPTITCSPNVNAIATSAAGAVVNYVAPVGTDNCSGTTTVLTAGLPSGSTFPIGTTTVTYTATDASGNSANCSFTVTVKGLPPVIVSPGNQTVSAEPGKCGAVVNYAATETTGIPASTITYSINPGSFFPVGTTAVTATATNAVGSSACTFNVTVTDNENPVIAFSTAPVTGTKTVSIPYLQTQVSSWSPVTFNFADPLPAGAVITGIDLSYSGKDQGWGGTGDYNHLYVSGTQIGGNQYLHYTQSYNLTYTGGIPAYVYGGNNTFQMYFTGYPGWQGFFYGGTMTIHYTIPAQSLPQAPAITVNTDPGVCGAVVTLVAPVATDNCGVATTTNDAPATFPVGTTTVTWTVTDVHGNSSTATQTVTVTDNEKPTITAPATVSVSNDAGNCSAVVTLGTPVTGDNCGVASTTSDAPATFPVGTTMVTWTVTDVHGNSSTATQTVTVTDNEKPTITAPAAISVNNDAGKCSAVVATLGTPVTGDNCGVSSTTNDAPAVFPVGTTTVTWTVTDIHGNSNTATQTVTVTDNEKPTITAPAAISVNNDAGICGAVVALGTPTTGDNCGVSSTTNDAPAVFPVGTTTVTWTVTDIHGNSNTATQTVTVTDNEKPTITAPATVSVSNDAGKCSAVVTLGTATTGDNCGVASTTNDAPAIFPVGTTTVTWTVTDIHGNSNTATQTVTVTDNEKPVIACAANQVFCANFGGVTTYSIPALSASDNCGIASTTFTVSGATNRSGSGNDASGVFAIGVSTVTYTVTDVHNNVSTCSFTVTINPLPVATITASTADAFCNKLTLTGSSTLSGPFSYQWLYANSTFSTSNPVDLGLTNGDGVYSLYTTDANGCRSEFAATYNYQKQNLSSSYTIIAYKEAELGDYNTVASGSVGVLSAKGEAEFGKYSTVTSPGSFVKAVKIELEKYASVSQPIRAAATPVLPTMIYNTANTRSLPNYEVKGGTTVTLNGNYGNLNIKKGSVVTLTGTVFGTIHTEEGAQLTFTKSSISIDKLQLDKGPKTGYTYVHFAPNSQVLISRSVSIGDRIFLNSENNKVTFYVGTLQDNKKGDDDRDDEARFNVNGKDVKVTVNVMMPNGKLKVNGGDMGDDDSKKSATSYVYMTGLFVAAEVEGEGKHVIWNSFDCSAPTSSSVNASAFVSQSVSTKEETAVTTEEELKITVMPNPSTTHFTLKLESRYETPVNMRVMDASGRVIDSRSRIGSNSTIQIGHNYSSGTYYAEMIQGTKRKVVQLIKGNK